jgi:NTP pyrophosphatase (non-canonical NTP hydrolase)
LTCTLYYTNILKKEGIPMRIEELENKIVRWATDKGLSHSSNRDRQVLKMVEEVGEVCEAMNKNQPEKVCGEIGDVAFTLVILAHQYSLTLIECLEMAWDKVSKREGETIRGSYIKKEDLK